MGKAMSVQDAVMEKYGDLATAASMSWEHLFHEALEYAFPEMQQRYGPCVCGSVPRKDASFCDACGTLIAKKVVADSGSTSV